MDNLLKVKNAIISVTDKREIVPLAETLTQQFDISLYSTGGTAQQLKSQNVSVTEISQYTDFPEILGGRVKTLHPKIFGGILYRGEGDETQLHNHGIVAFELVIVNLYPFQKVIKSSGTTLNDAIENIDIGGVSLIRAAAKNFFHSIIVTDPDDYSLLIEELQKNQGAVSLETRSYLAQKAFSITAAYDFYIAEYLKKILPEEKKDFPEQLVLSHLKVQDLRYGENPHQKAALYQNDSQLNYQLLQGKQLSFNNILDAHAALQLANYGNGTLTTCAIVKHNNPCGVAQGKNALNAYQKAFSCDPLSAFGGVIAINNRVEQDVANEIITKQFVEIIIAPHFSSEALNCFKQKPNVRIVQIPFSKNTTRRFDFRDTVFGLLVQEADLQPEHVEQWKLVTTTPTTAKQNYDLAFAWHIAKYCKSNAIVLVKDNMTIGIGVGQTSRIDSFKIAVSKAKQQNFDCTESVLASDGFFPFADNIELAHQERISAIIQPGGSIKDADVVQTCNQYNIAMLFSHIRHFLH